MWIDFQPLPLSLSARIRQVTKFSNGVQEKPSHQLARASSDGFEDTDIMLAHR